MYCRNYKYNLLFLFVAFCFNSAFSQGVSGVVVNAKTGNPIQSANVILLPGNLGSSTNDNGQFKISNVKMGVYKVQVSMLGFITKNIAVSVLNQKEMMLKIQLEPEYKNINEVKVLGNFHQKELQRNPLEEQVSLLSSISKIEKADLQKQSGKFWMLPKVRLKNKCPKCCTAAPAATRSPLEQ